jgi:starch synthase
MATRTATQKLNILLLSAEVAPFAKVGGLADVAGALPRALRVLGHDVRVVMPSYAMIETNPAYDVEDLLPAFSVPVRPGVTEKAYVKRTRIPLHTHEFGKDAIPVYLIGNVPPKQKSAAHPAYFAQAINSKSVYTLAPEPYVFFCRAVLEMLLRLDPTWKPDVIHCNDWHTGLLPVFARTFYAGKPLIRNAATLFTIHNLAYQGNFGREHWAATGLPDSLYQVNGLEFYGEWSFMKGGLTFADRINTVSENYACEIQTPEYGCGLDGLMRTLWHEGKLSGIVNGIDYEEYDPATDPRLPARFCAAAPEGKAACKAALQAELGLPKSRTAAVIGIVSRLADQKGLDLIHAAAESILELPVQFVLLGTGDPFYETYFRELQSRYPKQVRAVIDFDVELAQRIYAGSDLFLMPSRFEPCGLGQLMSLRYGTIPIVRATGGLADTIEDFDSTDSPDGNGFVFSDYTGAALLECVRRAVATYRSKATWQTLVQRALSADFSWARSAGRYAALYADAAAARKDRPAGV